MKTLDDRVLLKEIEPDGFSPSGSIIIPVTDESIRGTPIYAVVQHVGEKVKNKEIIEGITVIAERNRGEAFKDNEDNLIIIRETHILAIYER